MGIFSRIGSAITAGIKEFNKLETPGMAIPSWEVGQEQWTDWSVDAAIRHAFRANAIVYACIDKRSKAFASVPWMTKTIRAGKEKVLPDHILTNLLEKPNPEMSGYTLKYATSCYKLLAGEAFWFIKKMPGQKYQLWLLRPDRITIVPDGLGSQYYIYKVGSDKWYIENEDMIHHKLFNPGDDWHGLAPMQPAGRIIDSDNSAVKWNKASYDNRARPDGVLSTKEHLTDTQFQNAKKHLKKSLQGENNAKRIPLLTGGFEFKQVSLSPAELDFIQSRQMTGREICVAFGIHPEAIGLNDRATFENKKWAKIDMWGEAVVPDLRATKSEIDLKLAPMIAPKIFSSYDLSDTPAALEARKEKSEEAKTYYSMGVPFNVINKTLNLGFDPVDGGDTGYLPLNLVPVGENVSTDTGKAYTKAIDLNTATKVQAYVKKVLKLRSAWEKAAVAQIKKVFTAEKKAILKEINNGKYDVDDTVDQFKANWGKMLLATWKGTVEEFSKLIDDALQGKKYFLKAEEEAWTQEVQKFAKAVVADHVVKIADTTKKRIRAQIAKGLDENESIGQIYKRIDNLYEDSMTPYRSITIARTEVLSASGYASNKTAKDSGVLKEKGWVTFTDGRERDSHADIDGERVKINEKYSNGLEYPGDPAGAVEEIVQCRCVEQYFT